MRSNVFLEVFKNFNSFVDGRAEGKHIVHPRADTNSSRLAFETQLLPVVPPGLERIFNYDLAKNASRPRASQTSHVSLFKNNAATKQNKNNHGKHLTTDSGSNKAVRTSMFYKKMGNQ